MSTYGATITLVNGIGSDITMGHDPLGYGTWAPAPMSVANATSNLMAVTPDSTDSNGSQGTVSYTVNNANKDKLQLSFACTNANQNFCTLVALSGSYQITYNPPAQVIKTQAPLNVTINIIQTPRD